MRQGTLALHERRAGDARSISFSQRLTRRTMLRRIGAISLSLEALRFGARPVAAHVNAADLASVSLPPDLGQTGLQVYVPATGHTLRGSMLDYWRTNGAAAVYGNPISEPFASADGYYSQAFERAVFQYRPEYVDTEDPIMRLAPIVPTLLSERLGGEVRTGRRTAGGGDRAAAAWRPLAINGKTAARAIAAGGFVDAATGHSVTDEFLAWYSGHEGAFYLGSPLSEQHQERGATAQYFEGGLLIRGADGQVRLANIVKKNASEFGIDTTRVDQGNLPDYDEALFQTADNPNPAGDPSTPGRRWIEVSLSQQQLWAYQSGTVVLTTLVSTGLAPNVTLPGLFHVRLKYPQQDMKGFTDSSGEVIGFGDNPPPGTVPYDVPAIPNVMYFSLSAEALHGTYWHHNFGQPMSHGCVNLPLDVAAWMYGWAPLGTMVWIHE